MSVEKLMRENLAQSGLTDAEVKLMQTRAVSAERASDLIGVKDDRPGIWFPTFDIDGKPIPSHGAVRYFDSAKPAKFLGATIEPRSKYLVPKGSSVRASFTPRPGGTRRWREMND